MVDEYGRFMDPNLQDKYGNIALHYAVVWQEKVVVEKILEVFRGRIQVNCLNFDQYRPIDLAHDNEGIVNIIQKY
eukprot:CAMPEP_0202960688 /NCGR_PEP_ID=MMETSP1396-20130829/4846_1 /ASSEMBLY_ACC=CAM_ASM_000872 /TAXON_ID= /ORGANISM="Pseudokeronopsis sp., Strain Brazil" /LENGTH=74 /DNA_ID=CAMNT_0049680075 /DNA_START=499 /DNA_END=723 /DNA_ORIENTATION=-